MPISVRPVAALDLATLERCSTVELAAFASDFHSLAFPGPFPEDRAETKAQALSTTIQNDGCRVFAARAVDDEGSETLVGCARWFVYRKSMPEPELHSFGPGVHVTAATEMLEVGVAKVPFAQFGLDKMFTAWAMIWTGAEV
ncbi:hypothetical protein BN1708_003160 [Verticillium longisporum]|uniref:N-acetyltransferase domain-containing protein n=1 Tax=Verticillium longisporum TaxID=100787 RepID=A0A0G4LAY8_VERLO|nr:hypothetical protein BN1708_003160 [Verticillium longisporum]